MKSKTTKLLLLSASLVLTGLVSTTPAHAIGVAAHPVAAHPVAAHPAVHTTPHVSATHTTTHTTTHTSPTHTTTHHTNAPEEHAAHSTTNTSKSTKSTSTNFKTASRTTRMRLVNSHQHYTRTEANRAFKVNHINPTYQRYYHRQSIISNPWFWMFMINHHRLNQAHAKDNQYLAGYKFGYQEGQKDYKSHSRHNQNLTSKQEQQHNKSWQNGYYDGYNDGVTNTK